MHHQSPIIRQKRKAKKRAQQKKLGVFAGIGIGALVLIIGLLAWGSHYEGVSISSVTVEGVKVVDADAVASVAYQELKGNNFLIWNRANMLWYPKKDIVADIQEVFPRVKDISVRRTSMTAIAIEITERAPAYVWCEGSYLNRERDAALVGDEKYTPTCYFTDREGFIFDTAPTFSGAAYLTWYGGKGEGSPLGSYIADENVFEHTLSVVEMTRASGLLPVHVEFRDNDGYIFFDDDTYLMYPLDVSLDSFATDIAAVLEKIDENTKWEYLDMRFGNKVFFREKGEGENVE